MKRIVVLTSVLALALAVAAAGAFGSSAASALTGSVGPGFTISLKASGKPVKSLKKGTYRLTVTDKGTSHDFVLKGPGLKRHVTTVAGTGKKTVQVKLAAGRYKFYCTPHESSMFGFFTVK